MHRHKKERAAALEAVIAAADLCRAIQSDIAPEAIEKQDRSPVTLADYGAQALICRALSQRFPDDPIIAEEDAAFLRQAENAPLRNALHQRVRACVPDATEAQVLDWIDRGHHDATAARFWSLDPVDGTKGFLRKAQYAISLALIEDGHIRVGALCCPNLVASDGSGAVGCAFIAVQGQGAFEVDLQSRRERPIRVSDDADIRHMRTCESVEAAHSSHGDAQRIKALLGITADPARLDSQAKYAVVARGDAEAYLRLPKNAAYREKIWDHAGGALLVTEAGGRLSDIHGRALRFDQGATLADNLGVIDTNGPHHDALLAAIAQLDIGNFS